MSDFRMAEDGTRLATYQWPGSRSATIVMVHGLAEHVGRYRHMAEMFNEQGFSVLATDLRGFGASEGRRAYVDEWDDYLDDLAGDVTAAGATGKVILYGHSMGGLIALTYMLSGHPAPDLAVLSAAWLDDNVPKVKKLASRFLAPVLPRMSVPNGIDGDHLCHDPSVGEAYASDPRAHHRTTLRLGKAVLAAQEHALANVHRLTVPTLVLHGGADTLVPTRATEPLGANPNVERRVLSEMRHEVHNEDGGVEAARIITEWIEARL
jgi:acylglycerol lipase